eukprot:scaffold18606_cov60-Phaeocystis_antarctica.AAC.2
MEHREPAAGTRLGLYSPHRCRRLAPAVHDRLPGVTGGQVAQRAASKALHPRLVPFVGSPVLSPVLNRLARSAAAVPFMLSCDSFRSRLVRGVTAARPSRVVQVDCSCARARDAASWGASSFCISLFVKFGIGFPQTRLAPDSFRPTNEDAFPVHETITARRATPVRASCARRCMMAAEPRIASSPGAKISSITTTANSVSVARDTASSAVVASVTDQPWPK